MFNDNAVLLLTFNRLRETQEILEILADMGIKRIYIANDGPRDHVKGEHELVYNIRSTIDAYRARFDLFKVNYQLKNLGCKHGVNTAIDWFFEHEEQGIIIEDDCRPNANFFEFCSIMLKRYKEERLVSSISGSNPYDDNGINDDKSSYFYSRYNRIWGWATWRDRWMANDKNLATWKYVKSISGHHNWFTSKTEILHFENIFDKCLRGEIDTWDYQWFYSKLLMNSFTVVSKHNLVSNIGFSEQATHTTSAPKHLNFSTYDGFISWELSPKSKVNNEVRDLVSTRYRVPTGIKAKLKWYLNATF